MSTCMCGGGGICEMEEERKLGIRGIEHLSDSPIQYGIRTPDGDIITDPVWFSEADVIRGMGAFGFVQAGEAGTLVQFIDGQWKDFVR